MLELDDVTRSVPDGSAHRTVLDGVRLYVPSGAFVVVLGPSGSGKTTLVRIAAGLDLPTSGRVVACRIAVSDRSERQRALLRRREIGVVHQHADLDPVLNAAENVELPLRLDGTRSRQARHAAEEALARCGVGGLAGRLPAHLSGGERQRVALAQAVVGARSLVLADEPTAALDTANARALVEVLGQLARGGAAVLMTTHDSRLAAFADRTVTMRDGRFVGSTEAAMGEGAVR